VTGADTATAPGALVERRGNVMVITINRPEARNAINSAVSIALGDALEQAQQDPDVRVVVVTGSGDKSFCAGADLKALSGHERRALRTLGVRIGAFSVFLPGVLKPAAMAHAAALSDAPQWMPPRDRPSATPTPLPSPKALSSRGLRAAGRWLVPALQLERMDELLRAGGMMLSDQAREELGWSPAQARAILNALGFTPARKGEPVVWRRRQAKPEPPAKAPAHSPFAALAALKTPPRRKRRPRRRKARGA